MYNKFALTEFAANKLGNKLANNSLKLRANSLK